MGEKIELRAAEVMNAFPNIRPKQRRAASLLAETDLSIKGVANEIGVKVSRIRRWLKQPEFIHFLQAQIDKRVEMTAEERRHRNSVILRGLYKGLEHKLSTSELVKMIPMDDLTKAIKVFSDQLRRDEPEGNRGSGAQGSSLQLIQNIYVQRQREWEEEDVIDATIEPPCLPEGKVK